jgi:hypothetical protein
VNRGLMLVVASVLVGCGGVGKKNVAACEDYVATFACGSADVSAITGAIDCTVYEDTTCDISEYFTCLSDSYTCEGDTLTPDADKLATCGDLAVCA